MYVASLPSSERERIRAVVNMDMIGTLNIDAPTVLLEGRFISRRVIDALAEAAESYTGLALETSLNAALSDHVSFLDEGLPAVLTIEGTDSRNRNIHTGNDTIQHISVALAHEILRMNVAFVADALGRPEF